MSSRPVGVRRKFDAAYCHDNKIDDSSICHSDDVNDKDPWLVSRYPADADISKIVVVNRDERSEQQKKIVGASIRICSDSGKGGYE